MPCPLGLRSLSLLLLLSSLLSSSLSLVDASVGCLGSRYYSWLTPFFVFDYNIVVIIIKIIHACATNANI